METAAPRTKLERITTRSHLTLTDATPVPSWPPLSGNTFTPARLVIEVEQIYPDGGVDLWVHAHGDDGTVSALERWWDTRAAKNGHHDPRHMPESLRIIVVGLHPHLAHLVSPS